MNRFRTRLAVRRPLTGVTLAVSGLLVATTLTACGAGQISQTATQQPAVNGTVGAVGSITLRNVHLQAVQTGDQLAPGSNVDLMFYAINQSPDTADKLVSVTSDVGSVALTGDTAIPANGLLAVGAPDPVGEAAHVEELDAVEAADVSGASVALSKPISNGLTYDFTFTFEKAGETTLAVPISAGGAPRQGEAGSSHH